MGQVERQRDRTSFKDLAKLAATPPPASTRPASAKVPVASPSSPAGSGPKSDSGVVDLQAAALSDPHAAERAKSTPLASGSLFDDEGPQSGRASVAPPSMSGEHMSSGPMSAVSSVPQQIDPYSPASVRPSMPPASLSSGRLSAVPLSVGPHSAVAAMAQPQAGKNETKSRLGLILGSLIGVTAIAAGAVFFVRTHHARRAAPDMQAASQGATNITQPAATHSVTVAQADTTSTPAPSDAISPDALAQSASADAVAQNGSKSGAKPVAKKSSGKPTLALKDSTEVDAPSAPPAVAKTDVKATDEAPPAVGGSASLQDAMKTAAGPADATNSQAAATGPKFAPGSVPQRPSQGALSSAIGRSLPDARACLGPDDGVSYANVVFESSGGVQNVTLSGFAAGKPVGACIITALKKASVGPFAETTYSAKVTVRP